MKELEKGKSEHYSESLLKLIGGKWKPMLLFFIGSLDIARYSELKKVTPKLNDRTLTRLLKDLGKDGLIVREVFPVIPLRVEYSLTPKGKSLLPILYTLKNWGRDHTKEEEEESCVERLTKHSFLKTNDIILPKLEKLITQLKS